MPLLRASGSQQACANSTEAFEQGKINIGLNPKILSMRPLERKIDSLKELKRLWKDLDEDAGIRINPNSEIFRKGTRLFLFFYDGKYWINISNDKMDQKECPAEKKNEIIFQIGDFDRAWNAVTKIIDNPLEAWVY
jgi:hypothetical protein